jgi:hypothetical protein
MSSINCFRITYISRCITHIKLFAVGEAILQSNPCFNDEKCYFRLKVAALTKMGTSFRLPGKLNNISRWILIKFIIYFVTDHSEWFWLLWLLRVSFVAVLLVQLSPATERNKLAQLLTRHPLHTPLLRSLSYTRAHYLSPSHEYWKSAGVYIWFCLNLW